MKKELSLPAKIAKAFIENSAMAWLLIVSAFGGAIFAYIDSPKNHNPEIEVANFTVTIPYPGATAEEIDKFLTKEVEQVLAKLPKVDLITAQSHGGGQAVIFIKFEAKQNVEAIKAKVLSELELVSTMTRKYNLPEISVSVGGTEQTRTLVFGFISDVLSPTEIREKVLSIRDLMRANIPGLAAPKISGAERKVIKIHPDPGAMQLRKVGASDVINAIKSTNIRAKVGNLKNEFYQTEVEVEGSLKEVEDVKNLVIMPGVQLQDIAEIYEGVHESDEIVETYDPKNGFQKVVFLSFGKIKGHNVTTLNKQAKAFVNQQMQAPYLKDLQVKTYQDHSIKAKESTSELMMNLTQTILIVFAVLLLFLKFQPALNVTLAIPLVIAITLIFGYAVGQDINSVYLAGYILALGLLVDSATVVTEAIYRRIEAGLPKKEAVIDGVQSVGGGLTVSTITSVIVFFPLMTLSGEMGEFFFDFGFVMPVALIASLFVALSLSPFLAFNLFKKPKKINKKENPLRRVVGILNVKYTKALTYILDRKSLQIGYLFSVLGIVILSFFLFGSGAVKRTSSVGGISTEFAVYIDGPPGTASKITHEQIQKIVPKLIDPRIKYLQAYTASPIVGGMRGASSRTQSYQASVHGILYEKSERPPDAKKEFPKGILQTLRDRLDADTEIQALREEGYNIWFVEYPMGVPTMAPIVMEVRGSNPEIRRQVINELSEQLEAQPSVTYVEKVTDPLPKERIIYQVDEQKALQTGLTTNDIQQALSFALGTDPVGQLFMKDAPEPIALEAIFAPYQRGQELALSAIYIKNAFGEMVPLSSVIIKKNTRNERVIYRREQAQMDYLAAHTDTDSKALTEVFIESNIKNYKFPENGKLISSSPNRFKYSLTNGEYYEIFFDGDLKQGLTTDNDFGSAILVALIMVYVVLVYQFKSFKTPLVIMSTIPLGFVGIVFGFMLLYLLIGLEMSPTGLIGILALIGIVVNNSIMILEAYEQFRKRGDSVKLALIHACDQRFRPIMLTSMTTFLGILTLLANEAWQSLALVLSMGLMASVSITIFLIPVLYYLMHGDGESIKK